MLLSYEPLELLSENTYTRTFLLKNKETGKKTVAKCYNKNVCDIKNIESKIMRGLSHKGLLRFSDEFEDENRLYVLREYVDGATLEDYAKGKKPGDHEIIEIMAQLCDILTYLHNQKPPIIHRDIKPSNIIISDRGITLIDFSISRCFDEKVNEDTLYLGTKGFAPPEQYGYTQTDSRADIYAAGVLLMYLSSGSIDLREADNLRNRRIAAIIKKCTGFSPKERYQSAASLKSALLHKNPIINRKTILSFSIGLLAIAAIAAGCNFIRISAGKVPDNGTGSSTESTSFMSSVSSVPSQSDLPVLMKFASPVIEKAVRQTLQKADEDPITEDELLKIDQLLIVGNKTATSIKDYYSSLSFFYQKNNPIQSGEITSLADIEKMPNLLTLCLAFQQITDVSPLAGLEKLEKLELNGNPLNNIAPLSNLESLCAISLQETRVSDTSPLDPLEKLRYININGVRCDGYEFLRHIGDIEYLDLSFAAPVKVLPLLNGKKVRNFQFSYADLYSLSGFEKIQGLETLDVQQSKITDISAILNMTTLTFINLADNPIEDLTPLLALPNLTRAEFSSDMKEKVISQLKEAAFDIAYR